MKKSEDYLDHLEFRFTMRAAADKKILFRRILQPLLTKD
jgi:hypothetical protein